jgi:hypothetical protein
MPGLSQPDAVLSLHPDPYAPRAARCCVGMVDRPSPDLRDVVVLLTSELVTRAVMLCESSRDEFVELRIWMPADIVRVELRGARELLCAPPESDHPLDDLVLVDGLADRWAIDVEEHDACVWFEIDRHPEPPAEPDQDQAMIPARTPDTADTDQGPVARRVRRAHGSRMFASIRRR